MNEYNENGWKLLFLSMMAEKGFTYGTSMGRQQESPYQTFILYWTDGISYWFVIQDSRRMWIWEQAIDCLLTTKIKSDKYEYHKTH